MKKEEIIFVIAMLFPLIPAFLMAKAGGGWYYFGVLATFYTLFGIAEVLSIKNRKKSISKDIGLMYHSHPGIYWSILLSWPVMAIALPVHWLMMR